LARDKSTVKAISNHQKCEEGEGQQWKTHGDVILAWEGERARGREART
jgi:hypothetical protein